MGWSFVIRSQIAAWILQTDLVVDVNTIQTVLLDPRSHGVSGCDRISTGGRRYVGGSECRDHEFDPSSSILGFDAGALCRSECGPDLCVIPSSFKEEERKDT